jgi:hypothetical protein
MVDLIDKEAPMNTRIGIMLALALTLEKAPAAAKKEQE